jgi:hypothetical protein
MGADKLQAVHEALADVFNESNLNVTGTENSHAAFDHETLSEAFSEPHLNVANTEQSFARFDHAALTGMFGESPTERPAPTSFDQTFADLLSERPPLASDTQQPRPGFDHQGFAEILSEPPTVSTNTKPSQPSFDHQALAEMLTESRADPVNPPTSALSFDTESSSSSAPFSGQIKQEEPVAKGFTASPPTNAEGARPPRAKSLLAKLHHIFSTKEEPLLSNVEKDTSPSSLSGQLHTPEPMAKGVSTPAEGALPQPANSMLAELSPLSFEQEPASPRLASQSGNARATEDVGATFATDNASTWSPLTELPPLISKVTELPPPLETEPSQPILSGQSDFAAAPTDAESAEARQANSFSLELPSLNPIDSKIGPLIRQETSDPTLTGQPDNLESAAELASARPTATEPARPQQAEAYLVEVPLLISTDIEPPLPNFQREPSPPTLSGRLENTASTASTVTPFPPTNTERAPRQRLSWLLAELAPMVSANPKPPLATAENEPSRPTSSSWLKNLEATATSASVAPQANSESAVMQPLEAKRSLNETLPLDSTDTEPQPISFENESSPIFDSGQPDHAEPAAEIVAAAPLPEAEDARTKQGGSLFADLPPSHFFFERKPSPAIFSGEVDKVGPAVETVAAPPPPHAATAQQTKLSPLTDLPALASTDTKSSLPNFEQDLTSLSLSGQPDNVVPPVKSVGAAGPTEAEGARPQHISSLLAALRVLTAKPSPPILEKEASR